MLQELGSEQTPEITLRMDAILFFQISQKNL